jgi:uncharacterized protein YndB with AHSA1/START domain
MKDASSKDEFRATFTVELSPAEVWAALARKTEDRGASAIDSPPGTQVWLPGWEMTAEVLSAAPEQSLRLRKDAEPCKGTEILVTLEHEDSGTKVTVVQSGFGARFDIALDSLAIGWDFIVKDLALYLETGVLAHRHMNAWGPSLGAMTRETPSGLVVTRVGPSTLAERAGLEVGDRVLTLAGATVASTRDLAIALRTQRGAASVELCWVRGREKQTGSGSF